MRNQKILDFSQLCQGETKICMSVRFHNSPKIPVCNVAKGPVNNCVWVQEAPLKGGGAQTAEPPLHSLLHREHVDADKGTWGGDTWTRDRRMGMRCLGRVSLPLSQKTFPRLPPPCEWVGLVLNSFRLGEERRLIAACAVPATSSALVRNQICMSRHPQRKKMLQLSTLFSLLFPISLLK